MSKPKSIDYRVNSWSITWSEKGQLRYQAAIRYLADLPTEPPDNRPRSHEVSEKRQFVAFADAEVWLMQALGEDVL